MHAAMGSRFPLTANGSSSVRSNTARDAESAAREATTSPGAALAASRAVRFTASPMIVYVRRNGGPKSPAKTAPVFTPACTVKGYTPSQMARAVRSIRSSTCPRLMGAPAQRRSFPPSASRSLARKLTPCSTQASCT